jgi:hypothetical protein
MRLVQKTKDAANSFTLNSPPFGGSKYIPLFLTGHAPHRPGRRSRDISRRQSPPFCAALPSGLDVTDLHALGCLPQLGGTGRHKFSVADGTADATPAAVVGAIPEKKAATGAVQ